jgi:hypothetical protein
MRYKGLEILRFFMMDRDNLDDPQEMLNDPLFYQPEGEPHLYMSAHSMRDMINIVECISGRIGGYSNRIVWYVELFPLTGQLVEVLNYNDIDD